MQKLILGCGYLGERVAARWLADGHEVAAVTRSAGRAEEFSRRGIRPVIADVMRPETLTALPDAVTVLYAVGFDRSAGHTQREVSVDGLRSALAVLSGRCDRLIFISSTSVYGQSDGEWVDESSPCEPDRPNGQACLEAEQVVWEFFPQDLSEAESPSGPNHRGAVVLRLAGLYGPGRLLRRVEQLRSGEPIGGNPDAWLNLIHVDDAAAAVLACENRFEPGETYLIADDRPVRRREYFEELARLTSAPRPTFIGDDAANFNKRISNRKAREQLALTLAYPGIECGLPQALGL